MEFTKDVDYEKILDRKYEVIAKNYELSEGNDVYSVMKIYSIKPGKYEEKHKYIKRNPVFILDKKNT